MAKDDLFPDIDKIHIRWSKKTDTSLKNRFEARVAEVQEGNNRPDAIRQVLADLLTTAEVTEGIDLRNTLREIRNGIDTIQEQIGNQQANQPSSDAHQEGGFEQFEAQFEQLREELRRSLFKAVVPMLIASGNEPTEAAQVAKEMFFEE